MKNILFLILSLIILGFSSCVKPKSEMIYLNRELKECCVFKPGSWWVYYDSISSSYDTLNLLNTTSCIYTPTAKFSNGRYEYFKLDYELISNGKKSRHEITVSGPECANNFYFNNQRAVFNHCVNKKSDTLQLYSHTFYNIKGIEYGYGICYWANKVGMVKNYHVFEGEIDSNYTYVNYNLNLVDYHVLPY